MGAPQELIGNRYRLRRRIAAGGMGVVWEARDELLQRPVAVKQLRTQVGVPEDEAELAKQRAMREARITARLHHPNAVVVFDAVEHDGEPCLVMQYVPSEPLSAILKRGDALPLGEVARIGAQVAGALAAAHALGIVHRDVKPGNILIAEADGAAMLSDFGISHALGDATLTSTGLVHGTPAYLAPEVARGDDSTFASDVFSLGSTLYAAAEGAAPFGEAPNSIAVLHRVASGGFPAPQRSGALGSLLLQMMADDPEARPSMQDVARQLAALQPEEGDGATPAPLLLDAAADEDTGLMALERTMQTPTTRLPEAAAAGAAAAGGAAGAADLVADGEDPDDEGADPQDDRADADLATTRAMAATATRPTPTRQAAAVPPPAEPEPEPPVAAPPPAGTGGPDEPHDPRRRRLAVIVAAVVLVLLLLVGIGLAALLQPHRSAPRATTAPSSAPTSRTPVSPSSTPSATSSSPAISPTPSPTPTATSSPAPTPTPTPTRSTPASTGASLTAANRTAAISRYYGLVPGNTDGAWPLMTADYQTNHAGGRASFDRFWAGVRSVSASDVRATGADGARATITYHYTNGSVAVEDTTYRLVAEGGALKIASSSVVSSR